MAIMDEKIAVERCSGKVIDAASAVGNICEDDGVFDRCVFAKDVRYRGGVHEEPLRHLQSCAMGTCLTETMDCLGEFEVVVGRQCKEIGLQRRVVEN